MEREIKRLEDSGRPEESELLYYQCKKELAVIEKLKINKIDMRGEIEEVNQKIANQAAQIQALQLQASQAAQNAVFAASQEAQTAELIRRLGRDYPVNAVVVQPSTPVTFPTNCCGQFNGGGWGGNCNQCGNC